jgi:hypothetical protein
VDKQQQQQGEEQEQCSSSYKPMGGVNLGYAKLAVAEAPAHVFETLGQKNEARTYLPPLYLILGVLWGSCPCHLGGCCSPSSSALRHKGILSLAPAATAAATSKHL